MSVFFLFCSSLFEALFHGTDVGVELWCGQSVHKIQGEYFSSQALPSLRNPPLNGEKVSKRRISHICTFLSRPPYECTSVEYDRKTPRFTENVQEILIRFLQENEFNVSLNYFAYCTRHRFQIKGVMQSVFFFKFWL